MKNHDWTRYYSVDGDSIVIRQSWLNRIHWVFLVGLVTGLLLYITWAYPAYAYIPVSMFGYDVAVPYLWIIPLVLVCIVGHAVVDDKFVLTPDYLMKVDGAASWRERTIRLEYHKIQEIEIEHTLWQQALGIGDIKITPIVVGLDESVLHLEGIRHPRLLKDLVRDRTKERERNMSPTPSNGSREHTDPTRPDETDPDYPFSNSESRF